MSAARSACAAGSADHNGDRLLQNTAVVLLAAGRSARFGAEKLVVPVNRAPMVSHALRLGGRFPFKQKIAIVRPDLPEVEELCRRAGFHAVRNYDASSGMSQSLDLGIEAIADAEAALVLLADMPFVSEHHIRLLLVAFGDPPGIVASARLGVRMPPAIIGRRLFPKARLLTGDIGARALIADAPVVEGAADMLRDIDEPAQL